jgi:hypothetical protein
MSHLRTQRPMAAAALALGVGLAAPPSWGGERELEDAPPVSDVDEIRSPIRSVFPRPLRERHLLPSLRRQLKDLPPFFSDTALEANFRTYYRRQDRTSDLLSEAWALGGSIAYRSGWFADVAAIEVEGFTSQPMVAPDDRDGTGLLDSGQDGYTVLGIANAKLRYKGLVLTGYRQYHDLPYLNRAGTRMTPNTYESITLAKPEGNLKFSTGYTWNIKRRNSNEFVSLTEALGLDVDRGLFHAGVVWDPDDGLHLGFVTGFLEDVFTGVYSEFGFTRSLGRGFEARLDTQFSYRADVGEDLLGDSLDDAWNIGIRTSASRQGWVGRLGFSITGPSASILSAFGTNPTYVDLMQSSFNRPGEKAMLVSLSYDLAQVGWSGFSVIANFVAAYKGENLAGRHRDRQEVDLTVDYRPPEGALSGFWLRLRASALAEEEEDRIGTDVRIILRYDFPLL